MSKELLLGWLRKQQETLEDILVDAGSEYYQNFSSQNFFGYDAKKTGSELWLLRSGEDLCYDRPTIGFNYALWYHPKRINTFLKHFTDLIYQSKEEQRIEIFDLGAGTGAVLWAVGLIVQGLKTLHLPCPKIRVINVDTSPFMLSYNRDFLWKHFVKRYPLCEEISQSNDYRLNAWSNIEEEDCSNVWICASYLFDHSENTQSIAQDFKDIVDRYKPNRVILLSATGKREHCDAVANAIHTLNFSSSSQTLDNPVFVGALPKLYQFRNQVSQSHNLGLRGTPIWNIDSLYGRVLVNNAPQLTIELKRLNIYVPPEKDRLKIRLTKEQEDAAVLGESPTLVVGPAGCGKSVVLTQKIKNIVEASNYSPKSKILVTTFNKGLVKYLGDWIEQLLDKDKVERVIPSNSKGKRKEHSFFRFKDSSERNIYVVHFDILPTQIGGITWHYVSQNNEDFEEFHYNKMAEAVKAYTKSKSINTERYAKVLNPHFLLDEYQRVIYGLECNTERKYQTTERIGRGNNPQLKYDSERRRIVWGIIKMYLQGLKTMNLESFVIRRHRFLKRLRSKGFASKFTDIIVDEFQDCTRADYEIFYQLLSDPNRITFAGDLAQSINLGTSLHFPSRADNPSMRRFERKKLTGSFRLPMRISECLRPFSEKVSLKFQEKMGVSADIISPYKGAPPGSRPIFVYANDVSEAAIKVAEIFRTYKNALQLDKITVYEEDFELSSKLSFDGIYSDTEQILKTKGLEKSCVVWSTRTSINNETETEEFVYTILTRTVSLLIIVSFPQIKATYTEIIKLLVSDRLLTWDNISEIKLTEINQKISTASEIDDEDNSEVVSETEDEDISTLID